MANRESWLTAAADALWPITLLNPVPIRVSCGWPARKALVVRKRRVGECWSHEVSGDGINYLFISPYLADPVDVLATLLHEMIHATLPMKTGHKGPFARAAAAAGLIGKPTQTTAGPELTERLHGIAESLGSYSHSVLDPVQRPKQTTRLRLWECICPVKVRVASDTFSATCNECGDTFERKGG